MSKLRESHKQVLRALFRRYGVTSSMGDDFCEPLIDEILHINNRFNRNPSLDEALNAGNGSYKP